MSLFIRLSTAFFSNRKTLRLKIVLGNDALWIPPRLWAYAADNQPDGDFSGYSDEEIAALIGYLGNAQALLQALLQAGFLDDDRCIHGWEEHNSYHTTFADRAKHAAKVRWEKERARREDRKRDDKTGEDKIRDKHSSSTAQAVLKQCSSIKGEEGANETAPSSLELKSQVEEIYQAYPRKVAKDDADKAIRKALRDVPFETLLATVTAYAKTRTPGDAYTPYPASWFNGGHHLDDPKEWNATATAQKPNPRNVGIAMTPGAEQRRIEYQAKKAAETRQLSIEMGLVNADGTMPNHTPKI